MSVNPIMEGVPGPPDPSFDPFFQNVSFLFNDGKTRIHVSIPEIDEINIESLSISINYGAQIGACITMLAVMLAMTPTHKLKRPTTIIQLIALVICTIRNVLISCFFPSQFMDFYAFYAADYSHVPLRDFQISITGNCFSALLVVVVEIALMMQAWTMVVLWPSWAKFSIVLSSGLITLLTIGWRMAFTIIQCKAVWTLVPPANFKYIIHWSVITNAVSICWFCALFNLKLVIHLVKNRKVLSKSSKALTPMEVLVMTNGVLMIVPVIFAGLEWGHFTNFEAASLTLTSVALILPLGSLAARRMVNSHGIVEWSSSDDHPSRKHPGPGIPPSGASDLSHRHHAMSHPLRNHHYEDLEYTGTTKAGTSSSSHSTSPLKHGSNGSSLGYFGQISSRCEGGADTRGMDPVDVELGEIDDMSGGKNGSIGSKQVRVRVDQAIEQREERV